MSHRQYVRKCGYPPFFPEHRHKLGVEVRNIYKKVKTNSHKTLSTASVDKSVHKIAPHPNIAYFSMVKRSLPIN
jgi:hypothetical protein